MLKVGERSVLRRLTGCGAKAGSERKRTDSRALSTRAVLVSLALIPLLLVGAHFGWYMLELAKLGNADHAQILLACRETIIHRSEYPNSREKWVTLRPGDVLILPPIPETVPAAIRKLRPNRIIITAEHVIINVSPPMTRMELVGFAPDAEQFGTFKYINGLWFWNGKRGKK